MQPPRNQSLKAETAPTAEAFEKIQSAVDQQQRHDDDGFGGESSSKGEGAGYADRLKAAVLDCVDTAKRAPETFEEALAVIKGERAVKPDYERAASTVGAVRMCTELLGHSMRLKRKGVLMMMAQRYVVCMPSRVIMAFCSVGQRASASQGPARSDLAPGGRMCPW